MRMVGWFTVSRRGGYGSSIVFQDDARSCYCIVLEKVFVIVGETKIYGHVTAKDSQHVTMNDDCLLLLLLLWLLDDCFIIHKIQYV